MIGLLFLDHHWNLLFPVCQTGYGQNGDTPEKRHLKMATDCPDQNGDKLKDDKSKGRRELLDTVVTRTEPVYLVDDLNIRLDHA